ncbi:MAG: hypothetical protein JGK17_32025 [Microcoleus sp. PH2017_10_PVI_O_A]|uniref:hypothetical protein n=1 Tax=unclassified Microcoleus TaxID=2642155 RepID=UPI001D718BDE|nr:MULTISPECIES: hypothetical protein [unclassified Microcoleus]TAE98646.1 MAG: hypothetical protein EAZ79_07070 [Oscillatoriales cyanobacterium]MCC3410081.1 hypothetical protein [Microcoleus sp. PH2017_10_PVI_O_A]MCC3464343.1 hypothetical protein [Microcoleus sp. PH2017_11_PCY_U_A]MCC3482685.1 hypothetical protein [Microcoleus sp. PH2017_12_PCY_D_A]MCC3532244.1 hypothetical protein [Microcoleus sp. PH2017_21_RUC_O_A]
MTGLTTFLCCVQVPICGKIAGAIATQVNSKTEIYRQLVTAQNIDLAELYHDGCHTLLLVRELVKFDCSNLIQNKIYPT